MPFLINLQEIKVGAVEKYLKQWSFENCEENKEINGNTA